MQTLHDELKQAVAVARLRLARHELGMMLGGAGPGTLEPAPQALKRAVLDVVHRAESVKYTFGGRGLSSADLGAIAAGIASATAPASAPRCACTPGTGACPE